MIRPLPFVGVAALAAVLGAVVCAYGAVSEPAAFWPAWATACVFWIGCTIGCTAIGLLHPMSGGRWGWGMGRELHAVISVMPLIGLASLLLIFGAPYVYPWATDAGRETLNHHQLEYLEPQFVFWRLIGSLVVWSGLALWLVGNFRRSASTATFRASAKLAAFGMIALWMTGSSAVIDGMMAITPSWSSSLFGMLQIVGFAAGGMALLIVLRAAVRRDPLTDPDATSVTHDLGNFQLAFTMVWSYLAFSQFLIIWSADLPHETTWYIDRQTGGWKAVSIAIMVFHFAVPLALLLSRDIKRNPNRLIFVAGLILVMRLVDHVWTMLPSFHPGPMTFVFVAASWATLGGAWWIAVSTAWNKLPEVNLRAAFAEEPSGQPIPGKAP